MPQQCPVGKQHYDSSEWRSDTTSGMTYERKVWPNTTRYPRSERPGPILVRRSTAESIKPKEGTLEADLAELRSLNDGWDDDGTPAPTREVIERIERALGLLYVMNAHPVAIRPSCEGGAGICFAVGDSYAQIEFLNSGETHALAYSRVQEPEAWQINNLESELRTTWNRIRAFIQPR